MLEQLVGNILGVDPGPVNGHLSLSFFSSFIKGKSVITMLLNRSRMSRAPDLLTQSNQLRLQDQDGELRNSQDQ